MFKSDIEIIRARPEYLEDCIEAVLYSELGKRCFDSVENIQKLITDGMMAGELYIARSDENGCMGVMRIAPTGVFNAFPYLHLLAVSQEMRGRGVGSKLLDYFEKTGFEKTHKIFLLVSDFNTGAQKFYKERGFVEVGFIDSMFTEGIGEHIMMKSCL